MAGTNYQRVIGMVKSHGKLPASIVVGLNSTTAAKVGRASSCVTRKVKCEAGRTWIGEHVIKEKRLQFTQ